MCLYNHSTATSFKETMISENEKQYISYANTQNMMRYVFLLSNDSTDITNNIYTVLQKSQYYLEYLKKVYTKPATDTEFYLLGQFLYTNPPCLGNKICLKYLPELNPFIKNNTNYEIVYNVVDDKTFQKFIEALYAIERPGPLIPHALQLNSQNSITNTIQYSQNFQQDYLTAVSDPFTANLLELMEILYVSSIVPYSLYNVYILEYNVAKYKYPFIFTDDDANLCKMNPALCNVNSYTMFMQLYNSAMQMHLSMNKMLDSSGNKINSVNFIKNNKDYSNIEMENIKTHVNQMMFMINSPDKLDDLVRGLEPSYIMFYNALGYFYTKFNPETNVNTI